MPRPTPPQFTALAAEAAAFVTAGAGSPERIAALVSGLQVGPRPDSPAWHQPFATELLAGNLSTLMRSS